MEYKLKNHSLKTILTFSEYIVVKITADLKISGYGYLILLGHRF